MLVDITIFTSHTTSSMMTRTMSSMAVGDVEVVTNTIEAETKMKAVIASVDPTMAATRAEATARTAEAEGETTTEREAEMAATNIIKGDVEIVISNVGQEMQLVDNPNTTIIANVTITCIIIITSSTPIKTNPEKKVKIKIRMQVTPSISYTK